MIDAEDLLDHDDTRTGPAGGLGEVSGKCAAVGRVDCNVGHNALLFLGKLSFGFS